MKIHVDVTADDIAAAGPMPGWDEQLADGLPEGFRDPIERALARTFGRDVSLDADGKTDDPDRHEVATIGDGQTVLVVDLPAGETYDWNERFYTRQPVEPFGFDLEVEDWLVDQLLARLPEEDLRVAARAARTVALHAKAAV